MSKKKERRKHQQEKENISNFSFDILFELANSCASDL